MAEFQAATVDDLLETMAELHPDRTALSAPGERGKSYSELNIGTRRLAAGLWERLGRPDRAPRIAIVLPNGPDLASALLGACRAGTAVPLDGRLTASELSGLFARTRIEGVLTDTERFPQVLEAARHLPVMSAADLDHDGSLPHTLAEDTALVLMTSGSTGTAKITPLSHRNVLVSAAQVAASLDLMPKDRCLAMWEQHHIGGLVDLLLAPLSAGGQVIAAGSFDAGQFFPLLEAERPTWFQGVPATLGELCRVANRANLTVHPNSLRFLRSVAAALPSALMAELEERFGVPVIQTFGMTEAGPLITSTRLPPATRKPGSTGRSCGTEIRIMAPDGSSRPTGTEGEIAIRGENVFAGYENAAEDNAARFRDGWFLTGDTGYLDADGDLFLTGRIKQLINRGGEKINPQEVDDALMRDPRVADAACFALPHPTLGEDIAAAVVLQDGAGEVTPAEICERLEALLAPYKIPGRVAILEQLARTSVGKVDRPATAAAASAIFEVRRAAAGPDETEPLERFLAELWAAELGIETVEPDDDIAALGGDSLSSLRILLSVERAFSVSFAEAEGARVRTVRHLAAALRRRGHEAPPASEKDAGSRLLELEVGLAGVEDALDTAILDLPEARSHKALKARCEAITLYSTPGELRAALERAWPSWPLLRPGLALAARRWRSGVLREISAVRSKGWRREGLGDHLILYTGQKRDAATLIVGFCGNEMRLMMPTYRLLLALDEAEASLLMVRDPDRAHYANGVPGLGDSIDAVASALNRVASGLPHSRVVAFGTSAGGLAALCCGLINQWERAVAVGADDCRRHPLLAAALERGSGMRANLRLCCGAENARDQAAAAAVQALLPATEVHAEPGFAGHNLLNHLWKADRLASFLTAHCLAPDALR